MKTGGGDTLRQKLFQDQRVIVVVDQKKRSDSVEKMDLVNSKLKKELAGLITTMED
jgi:hypothetical protein